MSFASPSGPIMVVHKGTIYRPILDPYFVPYTYYNARWVSSKGRIHTTAIYTHEQPGPLPDKGPSPYSSMPDINISATGIQHIMSNLKPHKAAGPDTIPPTVLKELSHQISPILEIIFNKSLQTGQVPNDWKEADVAPIFKKGDKHNPCNYRPVSLTCIISKAQNPQHVHPPRPSLTDNRLNQIPRNHNF